jgi:hypothetical protein
MDSEGNKTGGRQKGTPNKVDVATRGYIESLADPFAFMAQVMKGEAVEVEAVDEDGKPKTVKVWPNLAQQIGAAKWLGDKTAPPAKDRPITFDLPSVATTTDAMAASAAILEAVASGQLTPSEAQSVAAVLESHRRLIESADLERRISELEERSGGS